MNIRAEAYDIILKVFKNNMFSDKLLTQALKKIKNSEDNYDLLFQLVKGIIKMKANLDYVASCFTDPEKYKNTDIKIKILLYLALYQLRFCRSIPEHAAVNETVELAKKLYGEKIGDFVNAVLRSYLRHPEIEYPTDVIEKIAIEHSFPKEIVRYWVGKWGVETAEYLAMYFNEPAILHLRVNQLATTKEKLIHYMERREVEVKTTNACPNVLISSNVANILNDISFEEGYFSIQDCSAAMVIDLLDPKQDENVLDLFAGRGGKASYIAEKMNNTGEIVAVDKIPNKVKLMKQMLERLQITNVQLVEEDAFHFGPVAPAYDKVIIDVPCSGWGVFQKKAELRWQLNQDIPELLKLQEKALLTAAQFVRVGGVLVYSTCTMNDEENDKQIERFLARNQGFSLVPATTILPIEYTDKGFLKTIPHVHNMDGAFAAKMIRNK